MANDLDDWSEVFEIVEAGAETFTVRALQPIIVIEPDRLHRLRPGEMVATDYSASIIRWPEDDHVSRP